MKPCCADERRRVAKEIFETLDKNVDYDLIMMKEDYQKLKKKYVVK